MLFEKEQELGQKLYEISNLSFKSDMRPDSEVVNLFSDLIPEVYVIGDAASVGNMRHATASAFIPAVEC